MIIERKPRPKRVKAKPSYYVVLPWFAWRPVKLHPLNYGTGGGHNGGWAWLSMVSRSLHPPFTAWGRDRWHHYAKRPD